MEWLRQNMSEHGWDWVAENYQTHTREVRKPVSRESYARMMRKAREELTSVGKADAPSQIRSLEQLEGFMHLDPLKYKVDGGTLNTWGNEINENTQVKLRFSTRDPGESLEEIRQAFLEDAAEHAPVYAPINRPERTQQGNLLEIHIPDLHLGRIAGDYNVNEAAGVFMAAVRDIIENARSYEPERVLMVIGSDWFNANGSSRATAHSKHPQDEDPRWMRTFTRGRKLAVEAIDYALGLAPVDVIILRGNHDNDTAFFLGDSLYAWYRNCDDVDVDNSEQLRKYYGWGTCLLGLTHGNDIKMDALPLLMAQEVPHRWAESAIREWHIGHLHNSSRKSYQQSLEGTGVRVEVMASLTVPDEWTERKGFRSLVEAQGYVWNRIDGKKATLFYQPTAHHSPAAFDELLAGAVRHS